MLPVLPFYRMPPEKLHIEKNKKTFFCYSRSGRCLPRFGTLHQPLWSHLPLQSRPPHPRHRGYRPQLGPRPGLLQLDPLEEHLHRPGVTRGSLRWFLRFHQQYGGEVWRRKAFGDGVECYRSVSEWNNCVMWKIVEIKLYSAFLTQIDAPLDSCCIPLKFLFRF